MSPLRGFLSRLVGGASADTPTTTEDAPERASEGQRSRRRGRRGGRNRNRNRNNGAGNGDGATAAAERRSEGSGSNRSSKDQNTNSTSTRRRGRRGGASRSGRDTKQNQDRTQDGKERDYSWGRKSGSDTKSREQQQERRDRAAQRSGRGRRRPSSSQLDAPLPEDIAFRAADEGGDRSILPARRRPPPGLRDTSRTIVGGARSLSGFARDSQPPPTVPAVEPSTPQPGTEEPDAVAREPEARLRTRPAPVEEGPQVEVSATGDGDAVDADADATETSDRPRRRRGRRGGRGRRRSEATPRAADETADDETTDDETADDETAVDETTDDDAAEDEALAEDAPADEPVEEPTSDEPFEDEAEPEQAPAPATEAERPSSGDLPEAFRALGLSDRTLEALADFGFVDPTPIQEQAIPVLLDNLDVVGLAQTGSGKTVAFGAPMVERLDASRPEVQAIVLVPTRELAQQVLDVIDHLAAPYDLKVVGLLGGRALQRDFAALDSGPHVVVGTPGRIIDHLRRGTLSLRNVGYAVLDEADQMLDIGFLPDIRRILGRTPKRRQTSLFSATMPTSIRRLIWQFMDDPETVSVDPELSTVESIEQIYYEVAHRDKTRGLRELVKRELKGRTLVFCNTRRGVDRLADQLQHDGIEVGALHGDMDQRRRDRVVDHFRKGELDILIATNVAARGIDIPEITHVVNFDMPQNVEEYIHRTGRTGRAGRDGKAITFVSEWDLEGFDPLLEQFGEQLTKETLNLYG